MLGRRGVGRRGYKEGREGKGGREREEGKGDKGIILTASPTAPLWAGRNIGKTTSAKNQPRKSLPPLSPWD
jgi:hypothetical protein